MLQPFLVARFARRGVERVPTAPPPVRGPRPTPHARPPARGTRAPSRSRRSGRSRTRAVPAVRPPGSPRCASIARPTRPYNAPLRGGGEGRERGLLQQAVSEGALELGETPDLAHDLGAQERGDVVLRAVRDRGGDRDRELAPDDRGHLREPPRAGFEPVDAGDEQRLERRRELGRGLRGDRPRPSPIATRLEQRAQQLLEVQRVALGLGHDLVLDRLPDQAGRHELVDQRSGGLGFERRERQLLHAVREPRLRLQPEGPPLRTRVGPQRRGEHDRRTVGQREQPLGQVAGGPIRPVEVVDRQHQRARRTERLDPPRERALHPIRQLVGREREQLAFDILLQADREDQAQVRERSVLRRPQERAGPRSKLGADRELGVRLLDPEPGPQQLDEGTVRGARPVGDAPALEPGDVIPRERQELGEHPRLAQPGVPHHEHHLPAAGAKIRDRRSQPRELAFAADQGRARRRLRDGTWADQARRRDGFGPPLHRNLAERLEHEPFVQARRRPGADGDRARLGGALEPRCHVRGVAQRDGLRVLPADEPDRGGSAVDAHADVEALDPPRRLDLARVAGRDADDPQRRPCRAFGVVLVGGGNAEVRADPVAHERLDHAAEVLDGATHPRDALADERLDLVGPEPFARARSTRRCRRTGP